MVTRRTLILTTALAAAAPAWAQGGRAAEATQFVVQFGNQLVALVNEQASTEQRKAQMQPLVEQAVAVDEIAEFVLGRYLRAATPAQRQRFTELFHKVLILNVTSKMGEFRGVTFQTTQTVTRGADVYVGTLITRPNQKPNNVQWVVSFTSGRPQIIDVVAEGTSLRLTQRSDYSSFLSHNNGNIDTLLNALERQVSA